MGLVFRKSIKLLKGVNLNLSKSGVGLSVGTKGARVSINSKGQGNASIGIPGTGVYYRKRISLLGAIKNFFGFGNQEENESENNENNIQNINNESNSNEVEIRDDNDLIETMKNLHKGSDETIDWKQLNEEASNELSKFASMVISGDEDTYLKVIEIAQPFSDLGDFANDFEVGVIEDEFMGINFNINDDEVIPREISNVLKSGKVSVKQMSASARNELIKEYVSSVSIRIAKDMFSLIPINKVCVNAQRVEVNPSTGNDEEVTILSIIFDREKMANLNFERINPFEALKNFEHNVNYKTTKGFAAVLPLK